MDNRVQWHPGFCAAMELELWDNRDDLEKECADAVLEVVTNANGTNIEKWKEDTIMCEALARIMEPEISQAKETAKREGRAEGRAFEVYTSVQEGDYGTQRGAEKLGISVEEFEKRMVEAGYHIPV